MHHVERIVRDIQDRNQGIVLSSHDNQRNKVDNSQSTGSSKKFVQYLTLWSTPRNLNNRQRHIRANERCDEESLNPIRCDAHVQPWKWSKLLHVSRAEERGVENVFLEHSKIGIRLEEEALLFVAHADEGSGVADGRQDNAVHEEDEHSCCESDEEVVAQFDAARVCFLCVSTTCF